MKIVPLGKNRLRDDASVGRFLQNIGYVIYEDGVGNLYAASEPSKYLPLANVTSTYNVEQIPREWHMIEL
jgi:hypothetical protein